MGPSAAPNRGHEHPLRGRSQGADKPSSATIGVLAHGLSRISSIGTDNGQINHGSDDAKILTEHECAVSWEKKAGGRSVIN